MLVCGIDIGTTSVCVLIASTETGETIKTAVKANDTGIDSSHSWERLQHPDRIVETVMDLLAECRSEWKQVVAVGISCQMHGILYIDYEGKCVSPLYTWQDGRGDLPMDDGRTYTASLADCWGRPISTGYGMVTHYYNIRNGKVPVGTAHLCTIGDYVAMKLCGSAFPLMDSSNAAGLGLFSPHALSFDVAAMERAGIEPSVLPLLAGKTGIVGSMPDGKPVVCAIGDNQASFLGTVPRLADTLLINVGTGAQISVYTEHWFEADGLETRPFPGGGYLLVGASLSGGKSYALLDTFFREICAAFGSSAEGGSLYDRMNRLAAESFNGGAEPLYFGTQFYGTRRDPGITGSIRGLTAQNFTPGHFAAGVLNGIVDELAGFLQAMPEQLRAGLKSVTGSGNGIRKNPVMQRLLRERFHLPLRLSSAVEEAAFGAAIVAAARTGLFPDIGSAIAAMQKV